MALTPTYQVVNTAGVSQATLDLLIGLANEAFRLWSEALAGNAAVSVRLVIDQTATGRASGGWTNGLSLGSTGGFSVAIGAPAYELATGLNAGGTNPDITLTFDPEYLLNELYLDPTPTTRTDTPIDRTDGLSVLLHEIGHALGLIGYYDEASNTYASNFKTEYDLRLDVQGGVVNFIGPNTQAVYGGPVPLTDNNYTHYGNTTAYPGTSTDPLTGLMNGVVFYRGYAYTIGDLDLAVLADTGLGTIRNDVLIAPLMVFMRGGAGNDTITGSALNNQLFGDGDDDVIDGAGGADALYGGSGNDVLRADLLDTVISGDAGTDKVAFATSGVVAATLAGLEALELVGGAAVTIAAAAFKAGFATNSVLSGTGGLTLTMLAADPSLLVQQLQATAGSAVTMTINGSTAVNVVKASLGISTVYNGGSTTDQIRGSNLVDTINGGNGNDKILGIGGGDTITGGAGADQFRYLFASDSGLGANGDTITDFTLSGDKLDFRLFDADTVVAGRQAVAFVGTATFAINGTAQARYSTSGPNLLVEIDVNGDGIADMNIVLAGLGGQTLNGTDFLL